MDELARAGRNLRSARLRLESALADAQAAAIAAAAAGASEVSIATRLGVDRNTVRGWLGKPRRR